MMLCFTASSHSDGLFWHRICRAVIIVSFLVLSNSFGSNTLSVVSALFPYHVTFPKSMTLRAAVLTNTVPLAYFDANFASSSTMTATKKDEAEDKISFPQYRGFQPDLLRRLQTIAKTLDNVTLSFQLEQAPPFSYTRQFEYLANDCNLSDKPLFYPMSQDDCNRYDLIVGDYYGYPSRSIRTMLTPPLLTTAAATIQYIGRAKRQIATLEEARVLQEPVCLLKESHYDDQTIERFPGINVSWCNNHTQCIRHLKNEDCCLFVEDELQLRYLMVQDSELEVTRESFDKEYIVWPLNARLDPLWQQLIIRWIYQAKVSGVLDELYNQYFSINFCPIGKAGVNCDLPCSPSKGLTDRHGRCICESSKWTGDDCSIEVMEDKNLIPPTLLSVSYAMIAINYSMVVIFAAWMWIHRKTIQVEVAQPLFLGLVLVGCLISTSTIFALGAEDEGQESVHLCMAIPWLYSVGWTITFGSLFAKIRRVYLIFKAAAEMQRLTISIKETVLIVGAILLVDVSILTTWTFIDPLHWRRNILLADQFGNPLSSDGCCTSQHWLAFVGAIAALHFTLLVFACYLCYVSRDIPTAFSEGKYVTIAICSNLQIMIVGLPLLVLLGRDSDASFFVRSVMVWMNDFVVVSLIFGNLMYHVHWDPSRSRNRSSSRASFIRAAMSSYISHSRTNNNNVGGSSTTPRIAQDEEQEGGFTDGRLFSTYDGTTTRPAVVPPALNPEPSTTSEDDNDHDDHGVVCGAHIPGYRISVSESEPRLRIDAGNGQTATVPITNIKFDGTSTTESSGPFLPF